MSEQEQQGVKDLVGETEAQLRTALVRAGEIIHDILCAREHAQVCRDITDTLAERPAPPPFDEPDLWKTEIGEAWALVQELGYPDAAMRSPEFEMFLSDGYWQARFAPGEYWGGGDTAGAAIRDAAAHWKQHNLPYPDWCRHPDQCAGKASCPEDPTCAD